MGFPELDHIREHLHHKMKACLVLLLAVAANAQYFNGFYNYPYTAGVYNNFGYGYSNIHTYGKREAEADPMHHFYSAMPYSHHATPYAAYKPVTYFKPMHMQYKTYSNDAVKPFGYAAKGQYVAQTAGSMHVAKREAEAEPTHTVGYNTYQTGPLSYVKQPIVAAYNKPMMQYSGLYSHYAPPYVHSYGKREAEAEAEPQFYSGLHYPSTYGGIYNNFGYSGIYNTPYVHTYGKREAEAEPQFYGSYYGNRAFTYGGYGGIRTPYTYSSMNYGNRFYY